jgi:hypothetical protein
VSIIEFGIKNGNAIINFQNGDKLTAVLDVNDFEVETIFGKVKVKINQIKKIVVRNRNNIQEEGLVAYYPFNGNANDESGNGNNGTVHEAVLVKDRFENNNSAYSFDGMNDYLDLGNPSSITGLGPSSFSICVWIKATLSGTRKEIISFGNTSLNKSECFYINSANQIESDLAYSYGPTSAVTVTDGNWHFVCVVNNDNVFQIYIDGAASGNSQAMSPNISSGSVHIGTVPETSACFFNGSIDEVRIYNRALSKSEILEHYTSGI